jgi:hypothetical protein
VDDVSRLRVEVTAAPDQVRELKRDAEVDLRIEGLPVRGTVEGVVPGQGGNMAKVNVIVANRDHRILAGSAATVLLPQGMASVLVVPGAALVREGDLVGVAVVVADRAERRWVRVGRTIPGGLVEVLSGLSVGDMVLVRATVPGGE